MFVRNCLHDTILITIRGLVSEPLFRALLTKSEMCVDFYFYWPRIFRKLILITFFDFDLIGR